MSRGWIAAGKAAAVTGAGGGIGRSLVQSLARAGARSIVAIDKNQRDAASTASMVAVLAPDCDISVVQCDVSDGRNLRGVLHDAGTLDLLCLNAGVATTGDAGAPDAEWQRAWETNVMQIAWGAQEVLPGMVARGDGALLITASAAGLLTQLGSAPYSVTKHAAVGLAEWLAITHGAQGITVSCVCPQGVDTKMAAEMTADGGSTTAAILDGLLNPDDVAEEALAALAAGTFLCMPGGERGPARHVSKKAADRDRWIVRMQALQARLQASKPG